MADKRKLQGEIDRCLKKVQEGVETFEDIWQKLHHAANTNQKEKYESDLKKEIKKLQRLRDQIKTWAASNEIKDKRTLLDNRKLIETQMERFKVVERETKTKAYSKEGLGLAAKIDPAQKEKEDTMQWLQLTIDNLNRQIDVFESQIESTTSHSRKKKIDGEKQKVVDELKGHLERHRYHIKNLETIMRMLDNGTIMCDRIAEIRDEVEYYADACDDPDFEENEFLYEDLNLDEMLPTVNAATSPVEKQLNSSISNNSSRGDEDEVRMNHDASASGSPIPNSGHSSSTSSHTSKEDVSEVKTRNRSLTSDDILSPRKNSQSSIPSASLPKPNPPRISLPKLNQKPSVAPHSQAYATAASIQQSHSNNHQQPLPDSQPASVIQTAAQPPLTISPTKLPTAKQQQKNISEKSSWQSINSDVSPSESYSSIESQNALNILVSSVTSASANPNNTNGLSVSASQERTNLHKSILEASKDTVSVSKLVNILSSTSVANTSPSILSNTSSMQNGIPTSFSDSTFTSLKSIAEKAVADAGLEQEGINYSLAYTSPDPSNMIITTTQSRSDLVSLNQQQQPGLMRQIPKGTGETRMAPLLGVAPLGPLPLSKDNMYQQAMLEASWRHMPHPSDSERLRHYLPRNPCPTPMYYHQTPLPHHDSIEFYLRLSTETLFFIFYYMEATKAQYLAARALKKQSWRFHTKYMMWFQRHEEPKTITDEYEQGTYIYFDYEKWGQRKKEGFTFEYRYLEDRELQ